MSELDDAWFALIILSVVACLFVLICGCACFTTRCFAPENQLGPKTELHRTGHLYLAENGDLAAQRTPAAV